jgi:hypothetical protein
MLNSAGTKTALTTFSPIPRIANDCPYKNKTPPREKYAEVASGRFAKTVPMIMACIINVLGTAEQAPS